MVPRPVPASVSRGRLVGEASPSYLFHPLAPERVRSLVPDARLVALVRDPVARAYSHYQHEVALGREPLSLRGRARRPRRARTRGEVERLVADPRAFSRAWWDHTYVARGRYAEQLERWLAVFPPEQLLVVRTEDLGEHPATTYAAILAFLGAPSTRAGGLPARLRAGVRGRCGPRRAAALAETFAEPNRRLEALLGRGLGW